MKFCQRCHDAIVAKFAKKAKYRDSRSIDATTIKYPCQIPIYDSDHCGNPIVRIWDCKENARKTYTLKRYKELKADGTL